MIDQNIDQTYQRVAQALVEVESKDKQAEWYEKFLWALRQGVIPAGRITSNAGAQEHKPATSTINCTVSGIIDDSMDDILQKNLEAGLTLKAGCGIGYEFSTLRPKGAYVSGAGAHLRPALIHGYLRQDMFYRVFSRRTSWCTDGNLRSRPSRRHGFHPRQTRRRSTASVQPLYSSPRSLWKR